VGGIPGIGYCLEMLYLFFLFIFFSHPETETKSSNFR
jgi:hypothetical protein